MTTMIKTTVIKGILDVWTKDEEGTCKPGQTQARTGCKPKKRGGKRAAKKAEQAEVQDDFLNSITGSPTIPREEMKEKLSTLTNEQMKDLLRLAEQKVSGNKKALIGRLMEQIPDEKPDLPDESGFSTEQSDSPADGHGSGWGVGDGREPAMEQIPWEEEEQPYELGDWDNYDPDDPIFDETRETEEIERPEGFEESGAMSEEEFDDMVDQGLLPELNDDGSITWHDPDNPGIDPITELPDPLPNESEGAIDAELLPDENYGETGGGFDMQSVDSTVEDLKVLDIEMRNYLQEVRERPGNRAGNVASSGIVQRKAEEIRNRVQQAVENLPEPELIEVASQLTGYADDRIPDADTAQRMIDYHLLGAVGLANASKKLKVLKYILKKVPCRDQQYCGPGCQPNRDGCEPASNNPNKPKKPKKMESRRAEQDKVKEMFLDAYDDPSMVDRDTLKSELQKLSGEQMKGLLKSLEAKVSGKKAEKLDRLMNAFDESHAVWEEDERILAENPEFDPSTVGLEHDDEMIDIDEGESVEESNTEYKDVVLSRIDKYIEDQQQIYDANEEALAEDLTEHERNIRQGYFDDAKKNIEDATKAKENLINHGGDWLEHAGDFNNKRGSMISSIREWAKKDELSGDSASPDTQDEPPQEDTPTDTGEDSGEAKPSQSEQEDTSGGYDPNYTDEEMKGNFDNAMNKLERFMEYDDGVVEIPHLYREMTKTQPDLTVEGFHNMIKDMRESRDVDLHVLNEVREAINPQHAIMENDSMYYYLRRRSEDEKSRDLTFDDDGNAFSWLD